MFAMPGETVNDLKDTIKLMHSIKKIQPNTFLQNCIFLPLPNTKMFSDAVELGYQPPKTLQEWSDRGISSRFEERDDITWMKKSVYKEYTKIYNDEFGVYKLAYEQEKLKDYVNPMIGKEKTVEGNTTSMFPESGNFSVTANDVIDE
jgi:radical SAM superfamily enzyme YgiQ (UPF0313 family)